MARFQTTNWSLILKAAGGKAGEAELAMSLLCEAYWYPVYAYVRSQGHSSADAEDLTQGYFATFLEKGFVRQVRPEYGRFRAFLLASARNFLHNERDRARSLKRGGGRRLLSLDAVAAERTYAREPSHDVTPEAVFEASWARTVLGHVCDRLEREAARAGGAERMARLRPFLTGAEPSLPYAEIAREWGVGEPAVRVAVHRQRKRFAALLREEVARTVSSETDVDDEIRRLFAVLAR